MTNFYGKILLANKKFYRQICPRMLSMRRAHYGWRADDIHVAEDLNGYVLYKNTLWKCAIYKS